VISRRNKNFRNLFSLLPAHIQTLAVKNYRLWKNDPWHPSLHFKPVGGNDWSVRIGDHYRALSVKRPDGSHLWYWVGTHEACNKLLGR